MSKASVRRAQAWAGVLAAASVLCLLVAVWTQDQRWAQTAGVLAIPTVVLFLVGLS